MYKKPHEKFNSRNHILSLWFAISILAFMLRFYSIHYMYYAMVCTSPFLLLIYKRTLRVERGFYLLIFYCLGMTVFLFASSMSQGRPIIHTFSMLLSFVFNLFLGYILNQGKLSNLICSIPFFLFAILVCFLIYSKVNPNHFFPHSSRNTFSWIALFAASLFYIVQNNGRCPFKPSFLPAIVAFIISLWSVGRSGIFSTGMLLIGVIWVRINRLRKTSIIVLLFLTIFFVVGFFFFSQWGSYIVQNTLRHFSVEKALNDPRIGIANNYMHNIMDFRGFLFGYNIFDSSYMEQWNYNLHNSFLAFHSNIGIAAFVFLSLIVLGIMQKGSRSSLLWFIGFALLFRVSTDTGALYGPVDFILFYFLFPLKQNSSSSVKNPL